MYRGERGEGEKGPVPVAQERAREDEACTASEGARSVKGRTGEAEDGREKWLPPRRG